MQNLPHFRPLVAVFFIWSKKIVVEYWGASRGNEPMHLHTDVYTPEDWEIENKDLCDEESQNMALEYFEVSGWYEVKEIEVEDE